MPSIERIRLPVKLALKLTGPTLCKTTFLFKGVQAGCPRSLVQHSGISTDSALPSQRKILCWLQSQEVFRVTMCDLLFVSRTDRQLLQEGACLYH